MSEEQTVLRWGGLAGMLGPVLVVVSIIILATFAPASPPATCGRPCYVDVSIAGFPAAKAALSVGYAGYLAAIILLVVFFVALSRAIQPVRLAPSLFGSVLGLFGLLLLAAGGLPGVAFGHLSDAYHAPGVSLQDQATLGLVAHGVQAILNETDTVGGILLTLGFVLLGTAMGSSTAFGKRRGGATVILGLAALAGIAVISIAQGNPNDPALVIPVAVLPLLLGWRLYHLSRAAPEPVHAA